ncbi:MAG TPA: hypothetical protein VIU41_03610 [Geobacteraceae bacterium]
MDNVTCTGETLFMAVVGLVVAVTVGGAILEWLLERWRAASVPVRATPTQE